ncbi:VOC family protein [Saccharopolyspora taberi]|uniref:VOC family protein n=1 Tax=Saccharopolyspora taberi TaxID=60895 RepID=A0ABN3V458_9PSEU
MEILSGRMIVRPVDPDRSLHFYRDVLGLAIYREFPGGTVFFVGQGFLELSGSADHDSGRNQALWLQVRDVRAEFSRLRGLGVTVRAEPEVKPWGLHEAWLADPDGMPIVLVEIPADHPLRVDVREP